MKNLILNKREFKSRLMVGTGKFSSTSVMKSAVEAADAEIVTVALRRVDLNDTGDDILSHLDMNKYLLLPNTSGAKDANEAVRLARLAKAAGLEGWIKLEVTPNPYHLLPDPSETLKAAEILVKEGFIVLPYINADPVLAKHLEEAGCAAVMPLAAPIGTNKGILCPEMIRIIIENSNVPVVVDAGLGRPSHAASAIEMGSDSVIVNTAIAAARNPILMAEAFKLAVRSAELARDAEPAPDSDTASASSPVTGLLDGLD
ncbi:MAG: thiazole synthase [Mucispirillum sp.]|nr:thiazole synthase [Mucispirillum sp.]